MSVRVGDKTRILKDRYKGSSVILVGTIGTVEYIEGNGSTVATRYRDARGEAILYRHALDKKGDTWEVVTPDQPSQLIIENGEMELFVISSVEVINGVVGQVKYGQEIVWQSDPVSTTDENGDDITLDKQHVEAQKVAQKKVSEVVRGQFAGS